MKLILACRLLVLSLTIIFIAGARFTWAAQESEVLACQGGAAADVDGGRSYTAHASEIRFLLTLRKESDRIVSAHKKYTGTMEGYPSETTPCFTNGTGSLYSCLGGAEVLWYYPAKKHGVVASMSISEMMKENRGNAAGVYNYSCTTF